MDMINKINEFTERILAGGEITKAEAFELITIEDTNEEVLAALYEGANKIRTKFVGSKADLCTIMNAKSGKCSEDCKFCAQSVHYNTGVQEYELLNYESILARAKEMEECGAHRFSLVTSGKGVEDIDFDEIVEIYRRLSKDTNLKLCASHGVIDYDKAVKLKEAGVIMYHHNVETSPEFYEEICTTHSYQERVDTIKNIVDSGLEICCGGILGLGEQKKDRIDMAFEIKDMGVKSIPMNVLNPVEGTPMGGNDVLTPDEILKTLAVYRFVIPDCFIRYAGGRNALRERQNIGFRAGVNAALVGNYLTTVGNNIKEDIEMITCEGFNI